MAKKDAKAKDDGDIEVFDPFVGAEDDDLSDMKYVQDETTTTKVETQPPETKEEAELLQTGDTEDDGTESRSEDDTEGEPASEGKSVESESGEESDESDEETTGSDDQEAEAVDDTQDTEVLEESEPTIPKSRFDELNDRMKKAEARTKELEGQLENLVETKQKPVEPEPEPFDYAAKNAEAVDAILEGDSAKYAAIQEEIRQATKDEALREAKKFASESDSQLQENLTFEETAEAVGRQYPELVEGNEGFDSDAYNELVDLFEGYGRSGRFTKIQAFKKAAEQVARLHSLTDTTAPPPEEPAEDNVIKMKPPNVEKKAEVAKSQPPKAHGGIVEREPKIDPTSMSDEEFEALPEATKRRLRGDVL